jgi:hypothetical protein
MKRSRTRHDETEGVAMPVDPARRTGSSGAMTPSGTSLMTSIQAYSAGDVTRQALHLALSALQIDVAWHAGTVSAETAMECLHHEIGETVRQRNELARESSLDRADPSRSSGKPTRPRAHLR